MSALLLNFNLVDFVVGGCGTGLGYLNSVMQYPGVFCGHLLTPLDAFLFARINAGNCVSLALNQGYGWAGEVNLRLIFDALFTAETGIGYPPQRAEPQRQARALLKQVSGATHRPMAEILPALPEDVLRPALTFPAFRPLLEQAAQANARTSAQFTDFNVAILFPVIFLPASSSGALPLKPYLQREWCRLSLTCS